MYLKFQFILLFLIANTAFCQLNLGAFDNHTNIGSPKKSGFVNYDKANDTYTIGGSGANMWFAQDEFNYLWTTIQGDFILRAELSFLGQGVDPHRKAGWIVKNDLSGETKHINATTHGDGLTSLQYRKTDGGDTEEYTSINTFPTVIQLERIGDKFIMSSAKFGEEFTTVESDILPMDNEVFVGLYVCAHNPDVVETVEFRNVRIIKKADPNFVPYREYIGSNLEILDIESGNRKIIYTSAHSIQAPNWTADGQNLIYNSKGRLYSFNLRSSQITNLNTGFAVNNNNDHVLSFDGSLLGISNHNPAENNASSLYYLSSGGSDNPTQVTKSGVGASYLHGWSPDNKSMLFTGERNGQYDIYSIDVETGNETQLTNQKALDDGSEFTPDGKHIFFNSSRTGKMKLWKMDANGKNQEQITFDDYNDWFPHISPDQKWIVFISFPKDIDPNDHPFYRHCLIRIMPFEGGKPKTIAYIYGGQGSI
ncbi:TolB family protein, partial [Fulvivirga lutimaris]|uniref:TolB family protein n=1 Tax=Fulvivirga lutimaris TaxID=1819566 RepID=UPI0012BBCFD3